MTYRGKVSGGVVVLEEGAQLPEGTAVNVEPVEKNATASARESVYEVLAERYESGRSDGAERHNEHQP